MTNYCVLADCVDPALTVESIHVDSGNVYVDVVLRERGIAPSDVTLPQPLLTQIAAVYAKREAAIAGAMGEDSILIKKAGNFKTTLDMLISGLSKPALGITETVGAGFGNVVLGRG